MTHPSVRPLAKRREDFDRRLMKLIAERRMPVMGIGVGMQLINISQGGNLLLHIPEDLPKALPHSDTLDKAHRCAWAESRLTLSDQEVVAYRYDAAAGGAGLLELTLRRTDASALLDPGFALWLTRSCTQGADSGAATLGLRILRVEVAPESVTLLAADALGILDALRARRPRLLRDPDHTWAAALDLLAAWAGLGCTLDALALAVRVGAPIFAVPSVLDQAGLGADGGIGDEGEGEGNMLESTGERVVDPRLDVFRDFVNSLDVDPETEDRQS